MEQTAPTASSSPLPSANEPLSYGPAGSLAELQQCFSLAYHKYRERELVNDISGEVFFSPHHLLPHAVTLVGRVEHTVFTTLSVVMDGPLGLPLDTVFRDELERLRQGGAVLGELGLFADRRKSLSQSLAAMHELFRFGHWYVDANYFDYGVVGVHPRHAAFYERLLGFQLASDVREHPKVRDAPAVLLIFDREKRNRIADRCKYVRNWLENPVHVSVWEQRYRPTIPELVALTSLRDAPDMLDSILPFHRTAAQLAAERQAQQTRRIRKAG